ncbi:HDIG domain-containing protein [Candidatus Sumerlaeota bacterium]|nr:HDIG domain-containing protein [Candidatus Sumerlaeota bacterium]
MAQTNDKLARRNRGPREGRTRPIVQPVAASLSLIIITALIVVTISPTIYLERHNLALGSEAPRDITAPFDISVPDEEAREELLDRALASVPRIYEMDVEASDRAMEKVDRIFALVDAAVTSTPESTSPEEAASDREARIAALSEAIQSEIGVDLTRATLLTLERNRRDEQLRRELRRVFHHLLNERGIEINDRAERLMTLNANGRVRIEPRGGPMPLDFDASNVLNRDAATTVGLDQYLARHSLLRPGDDGEPTPEILCLREIVEKLIVGNIWANEEETRALEQAEAEKVTPEQYTRFYPRDALIITRGAPLLHGQYLALRAIDEQKPYYLLLNFVGNTALVICLLVFLTIYLNRFQGDWSYTTANVNVIGLPLILVLLLGRIIITVLSPPVSGYFFPAGALGMLGVILIGPRVGLLLLTIGCLLFGVMTQMHFQFTAIGLVGGSAAVLTLLTIRRRRDILRAGVIAGIATALAILVIRFIDNPALMFFSNWSIARHMAWGVGNGLFCSMITFMSLVVFEFLFRVTTDLNLIELTSIKTPLLRELEERTPGTYQHTLNVSKLAEAAAEAIGANYLLVRAGAHYHDIGKMEKPNYFTENQVTANDRRSHSKLAPSLSALIIKEHVKRGIELARLHRLPDKVIDFIPQHHGTSQIKYFLTEAQRRFAMGETADPVNEEDFRYPGPKPQSAETAIVMLADSVEATATAKLTSPTVKSGDVKRLVHATVREKFNDGQLDECNLTLADLTRIRESFVNSLMARYHQRIDYPAANAASRGA